MRERQPVHILRRLGAICYDSLLLVAVLFVAGLPLPLIPDSLRLVAWVRYATFCYLLVVSFAFFGWFWTHGGQTLGMRAWRIRVIAEGCSPVTWKLALRRFSWSILSWAAVGLGFLWSILDPRRLAWHDRLSGTRLVRVPPASQSTQQEQSHRQEHQGR